MAKQAVVPLDDRPKNQVDVLHTRIEQTRKEIERIQGSCPHDYRLVESVVLQKTRVDGVFDARPYDISCSIRAVMLLRCLDCSHEKNAAPYEICPECLTPMPDHGDFKDPEEVFGPGQYGFNVAEVFTCPGCGHKVAKKTWDK